MRIEEKTMWTCDGRIFDSEDKAKQYEQDVIGRLIVDSLCNGLVLTPREKLKLLANIIANRTTILQILEA